MVGVPLSFRGPPVTALTLPKVPRAWRTLLDVAVFQAAWFACVASAARGETLWGAIAIAAAVVLHLALSDNLVADAALAALALCIGVVWDTFAIREGLVTYASPGPFPGVAPLWILLLWVLFATTLRGPLRWMHGRPWVAALFGAIGGPLSYAAAARMGACAFGNETFSLAALGAAWALITPVLVEVARRLDAGSQDAH